MQLKQPFAPILDIYPGFSDFQPDQQSKLYVKSSSAKRYKVNDMNYFSYLEDVRPKNLFEALQTEQLQTIAIVLVHINRDLAADTLQYVL